MTNKADFYAELGVKRDSTAKEIKDAYRKLASKYHPDKKGGNEAKFQQIQDAYDTLGNKKKRALYDNKTSGASAFDFDMDAFRRAKAKAHDAGYGNYENPFRNRNGNPFTADDINNMYNTRANKRESIPKVQVTLADAYNGVHKVTPYGSVTIPKGIRTGARMLVGSDKRMVEFHIAHHPRFKRTLDDLLVTVDLNVLDVITGGKIRFRHLDGKTYEIKIQSGIQHGQVMKVGGKGMPNPETDQYGDLLIECNIVIPSLTQTEKDAIIAIHKPGIIEV